ncbi:MAG: response regulator transcription factor [Chloroflexi bacterium]|nr:response regulator transcription factor [Chloroflexota bacterium]
MKQLTVFIADNQPIFRQGLRQVLSPYSHIEVIGECDLTQDVCNIVGSLSPDVALVEVTPFSRDGFGIVRQIAVRYPGVAVVALSSSPNDDQLFQAVKSGAAALVGRNIIPGELVDILLRVGRGERPIDLNLLDRPNTALEVINLFRHMALRDRGALLTPLSPRELEILGYVANGYANKRIAIILELSAQTIKNHLTSILRKLDANDRTQAVVLAVRKGWLSLGGFAGKREEGQLHAELV